MNKIIDNYVFNTNNRTITLTDYVSIKAARIISIINVTKSVTIYEINKGYSIYTSNNIIYYRTLDKVRNDKMSDSDELQIIYYEDNDIQNITINNNVDGNDVIGEFPSGVKDGINDTFTISHVPKTKLILHLNGLRKTEIIDFTLDGTTLTMYAIPYEDDVFIVDYKY